MYIYIYIYIYIRTHILYIYTYNLPFAVTSASKTRVAWRFPKGIW